MTDLNEIEERLTKEVWRTGIYKIGFLFLLGLVLGILVGHAL